MPRLFLLLLGAVCLALAAADKPQRVKKVLIVGIDGCRTDALRAASAPHLVALVQQGSFAENTQILPKQDTGADTVSGPGWSAILTGVWADKHGVIDNAFRRANYQGYPHFFKRLNEVKPKAVTASVVTWPPIHEWILSAADEAVLVRPDTTGYPAADAEATRKACAILRDKNPDAMFLYLGNVDETGHAKGFSPQVPEYVRAIEGADRHIGNLLTAVQQRPTHDREDWLILLCTDHGGRGTDHARGHSFAEVRTVWLIVSGISARLGKLEEPTALVDVAATALTHLGVPIDPKWKLDGRPVGLPQAAR